MSDLLSPITKTGTFQLASLVLGILNVLVACALLFWIYRDARKRDAAATAWTVTTTVVATLAVLAGVGLSGYGFGPLGFFGFAATLLMCVVYLVMRPSEYVKDVQEQDLSIALLAAELDIKSCPHCHHGVSPEFLVCPTCSHVIAEPCAHCGRPVRRDWKRCPYCGTQKGVSNQL